MTQSWAQVYKEVGINPDLPELAHANLAAFAQDHCKNWASQSPNKMAFTCVMPNGMNGRLSFQEINDLSDNFAAYLRQTLGLSVGDRVAVQLPNCLAYPVVAFGIFKAGCVLVNTNPLYTAREMVQQFNDSGATVLVIVDMFADKLPAVLTQTRVQHIVLAGVSEFFPAIPKIIIRGVQKIWTRVLPPVTVPHTRLSIALHQGRQAIKQQTISVESYWANVGLDDLAVLQYTGGTTGVSRGAELSHRNLLSNVNQILAMGATHTVRGKECVLTALPLYHIFAFTTNLLSFLALGAHNILVLSPRPVQNLQRALENYPITWVTGVNTLFNALLNEEWFLAYPPRHLKASIAGGTSLHSNVAKRWRDVTHTPIAEGYGLTEASPVVSFHPLLGSQHEDSIGIPVPGTEVKLVSENGEPAALNEPGEIWVRGPQVMRGYWKSQQDNEHAIQDGWLATGDIGMVDGQGFLKIVDRKKDMILVSGFNVYPNEVESVIALLDAVLDVAVVGIPNCTTGEAVRAYVVQNPDSRIAIDTNSLIAHCRQHLAPYKIPCSVVMKDALPKSTVGKVLRKNLKAEVGHAFQTDEQTEQTTQTKQSDVNISAHTNDTDKGQT
jgi:long-chain acyl-CoA synthetase